MPWTAKFHTRQHLEHGQPSTHTDPTILRSPRTGQLGAGEHAYRRLHVRVLDADQITLRYLLDRLLQTRAGSCQNTVLMPAGWPASGTVGGVF